MVKQAPTAGRLLVMVGFALSCFGLLLFLWLAFGGPVPLKPKGYRFETSFGEATQLAQEADVRISGVPVGKVKTIEPQDDGRSRAIIELEERFAPIPRNTQAMLRQKTLLGETYIELTPGDRSSGMLPEEGRLPPAQVSDTVELDEIFRAFDPRTRHAFRVWMQEMAVGSKGRGTDINAAFGNLVPFTEDATRLLEILNSQEGAVRQVVRNTGEVFDALSERRGQLSGLITNSNRVFETTAARDEELAQLFRILPTFQREARTTVTRLEGFARDTDPLVTQLRPAARELSPTLVELARLAPDLRALFRDLDPLITASERGLPATQRFLDELGPFLGEFDPTLRQLNPILSFLGDYHNELRAFFANTTAVTNAFDVDSRGRRVHYLRTQNPLNPENFAVYPRRIGSNRPNPYQKPGHMRDLPRGLPVYENRHCGRGTPTIVEESAVPILGQLAPDGNVLLERINQFAFPTVNGAVPAPPCRKQSKYTTQGNVTDYPQVEADATGVRSGPRP
jgi:phospholipid/cholesterol/gamma-HCH transport system substrate-binding protein